MIYLLGLSFLATLSSQTAMDFFVLLMSIVLIVQSLRRKGPKGWSLFTRVGIECFWPLWIMVIGAGYLLNNHFGTPILSKIKDLVWIFAFYFLISALRYVRPDLNKVKNFIFNAALSLSFISLVLFIVTDEVRVGGLYRNPMTLAHSYSLFFLTAFGIFLSESQNLWLNDKKKFIYWLGALFLLAVTLLMTMTRGVWIGLFVGVLVISFLISHRTAFGVLGAVLAGVLGLFFLWPKFHDRLLFAFNYKNNYDSERMILWKTNWLIFKDYPLFGAGYGENVHLLPQYYAAQGLPADQFVGHSHNQFIHIIAGTGILGLLCYLFLYFYFVRMAWQLFKSNGATSGEKGLALGFYGALIGFAVGGLTESNFEHAKVRMVLLFIWAFLVWMRNELRV